MKFPVIIKDGKSTITFTSNDHGTYESGAACMSTLEDMMVRVNSGKASVVVNITFIIQTAERMIRDNTTTIGAICAEWNRINFEANTGLSFSTPKTRKALVAKLEAAIIELNSRDSRMVDGIDDREFSGNSIAAAHDEAFKMDRERTANQLQALATRMDTITDEALCVDSRINAHNDLCDLAKAPQHLYAGEDLDLTICFEQLQAQLTDFIYNK